MVNWFPFTIPGDLFYGYVNNCFEWINSMTWPLGGLDLFLALCHSRLQWGLGRSHLYKKRKKCTLSWRGMGGGVLFPPP